MSYQTRRSAPFGQQQQQQQSVGNIGQRRPVVTNNFVPGGQLNSQNKQGSQTPQRQGQQQQQQGPTNTGIQFRNQQQQSAANQKQPPALQAPAPQAPAPQAPAQQVTPQQQKPAQPIQQQPQMQQQQVNQTKVEQMAVDQEENGDDVQVTGEDVPKKKFWPRSGPKISKKEKRHRRNLRLAKVLQPKNAVMILHELVRNTSYTVTDCNRNDDNQFKAVVTVEGEEHTGYGRSKVHAKNSAAENALKHLVKHNKLTELKKDEDDGEKMDIIEEDVNQPLPWQHVASFAIYKLFTSWGEDPNLKSQTPGSADQLNRPTESKPAKKLPANPELVNPLMLINQMLPGAQFEEIGKSGNPPNVTFSFKCIVQNESFIGTGPNKKVAKKMAAFGACHKILGINYPPDVYVPIY